MAKRPFTATTATDAAATIAGCEEAAAKDKSGDGEAAANIIAEARKMVRAAIQLLAPIAGEDEDIGRTVATIDTALSEIGSAVDSMNAMAGNTMRRQA